MSSNPNMSEKRNDKIIAAAVTVVVMLALLLFLFFGGMNFDRALLAHDSTPEIQPDELFIEPELLTDLGETDASVTDKPAPVIQGEPEKAESDNTRIMEPGENPKPAPQVTKKITQKKESPVKATEPTATKEERQKITSSMADKFSGRNGAPEGSAGSSGSSTGLGIGIKGTAAGRSFLGCDRPNVELRHKTTVKVSVVINAEGRVVSASASGGSSAAIRRACEQAARSARWSPKKGASETRGSITFTITPR